MREISCCAALVAACVVSLTACVAPARDDGAFTQNAKSALESAASEAGTATLVIDLLRSGSAPGPYADTVVTDSENALAGIRASFGSVDPPGPPQDALRDTVDEALAGVEDALAHARIAVRRGDADAIRSAGQELEDASATVDRVRAGLP